MKQLFDYCFYRIAMFYKKHMPWEDYITQGHTLLISVFCFYAISLLNLLLYIHAIKITKLMMFLIILPFCIIVFFNCRIFPNSQQLFEKQKKQHENERLKWIKGFFVFLFVLGSVVSLFLVGYLKKKIGLLQ